MELGPLVAEALLTSAQSTEVLGRLGDYIVVELEVDSPSLGCKESATLRVCSM